MSFSLPKIVYIGYYNTDVALPGKTLTDWRGVTMFEIELPDIESGISYIGDESSRITPDMIICARPGQTRRSRLPFKCYFIHMIVEDGILYDMLSSVPTYLKPKDIDEYREIFLNLYRHNESSSQIDEVAMQGLILKLIYKLYTDSETVRSRGGIKGRCDEVVSRAIGFIQANLTEPLSLSDVAREVGFSPIYFHKIFKAQSGLTLRGFVENERIKKASTLLVTTDLPLSQIASECGFSSQSYLNYAFKRKTGKTPREYAKANSEKYMMK